MQKKNRLLQVIEKKPDPHNVIRPTKKKIQVLKNELAQYLDSNGYLSYSAKKKKYIILGTNSPKNAIAECPQCKIGQLMIIRSPVTKKTKCEFCKWPIVIFRYNKKQKWTKQCSNFRCESRKTKV